MFKSLTYLPPTIISLLVTGQISTILSPSRLQSAWFGSFWSAASPGVRETGEVRVIPLLEGRVKQGKVLSESSDKGLCGTVLEVGPGTGNWVSLFANTHLPITKIYGVEPNSDIHDELRQKVLAAGLGNDMYEIVPLGIEDLASSGRVAQESVDCIVSIMCLCSIPEPEKNIRELFGYLKPGGRWFVYEHVRCESEKMRESGLFMRVYQGESNLPLVTSIYACLSLALCFHNSVSKLV